MGASGRDSRDKKGTRTSSTKRGTTTNSTRHKKLQVVLKCDSDGTVDAVEAAIAKIREDDVQIEVIHSGIGSIGKSDLLMALTGSKLVLGFEVSLMPKLEQFIKEKGIEIRLYNVIYRLVEDLAGIAQSMVSREPEERLLGRAKVIALFKSSAKGIIIGCEVLEGTFELGERFRIISAMGPVYTGRIGSMQIEKKPIKSAKPGQQVGIKIPDFQKVKIGDLVECFQIVESKGAHVWRPKGEVFVLHG